MASTVRMLAAGISLAANTFAIIMFIVTGGAIFTPIEKWYSAWNYASTPVIDPQMVQWIFPAFFPFMVLLEIILIFATVVTVFSKKTYYTDQGY